MTNEPNDGRDRPDAKAAWSEAGERLSGLGARLKQHYQNQHAPGTPSEPAGGEVKEAAKRLNQAVHDAFDALASASRDQEVKDDARRAGRSVADALAGTFAGLSGDLGKVLGGSARPGSFKWGSTTDSRTPAPEPDPARPDYGTPSGAQESPVTPEGRPEGTPEGRPPGTPEAASPKAGPPATEGPVDMGPPEDGPTTL